MTSLPTISACTSLTKLILLVSQSSTLLQPFSETASIASPPYSHRDNLLDARLRDVLHEAPDLLEVPLSVDDAHDAVHPVDIAAAARVIPSVLRSRERVEVEQYTQAVLSCPVDRLEEVPAVQRGCSLGLGHDSRPRYAFKEWLLRQRLDSPVADRDSSCQQSIPTTAYRRQLTGPS